MTEAQWEKKSRDRRGSPSPSRERSPNSTRGRDKDTLSQVTRPRMTPEEHEAWCAKQTCHLCHNVGHLKAKCKMNDAKDKSSKNN